METIYFKIGKLGSALTEFSIQSGATVADALVLAGHDSASTVKINNVVVSGDHVVQNDDRLVVGAKVEGGNR